LWSSLRGGWVHSGFWMKAWPSWVLQHSKRQQFTKYEYTKFLQTLTYCLQHLYKLFSNLKGSLCDIFRGHLASKG
jgi:hypothetical protein